MSSMVWLNLLLLALRSIQSVVSEKCVDADTLRLVQTRSITLGNAGRVEICMGGVWGTIAADSIATPWSEKNAQVACIQLGFSAALNAVFQRTIPFVDHADGSVPVHLMRVECTGVEQNLTQCSHIVPNSEFSHENDAYVVCRPNRTIRYSDVHAGGVQPGDIRLFGSSRDFSGAVQIYSTEFGWQGICPDTGWMDSDAAAICQELGYADGHIISSIIVSTGPGGEPVPRRLYSISCPADSSGSFTFGRCSFRVGTSDTSNCDQTVGQYASVSCVQVGGKLVRLLGGDDSREGIVEISYDGRWGMVCDEGFSRVDAQAVCQGLGYDRSDASVMRLSTSSPILKSESNVKPIWLTQVACTFSDDSLSQCVRETNIIGYANCSASNIAAVNCGDPPGPLSSGQIYGIVFAAIVVVFVICPFVYVFGKDYWRKRHSYSCYNTLTTPSSWCSGGSNRRRTWQPPRATPVTSTATGNSGNTTSLTFDLHHRNQEPEAEPSSNGLSDPGLSKAPPPSYQAATNYPTHDPSTDLPPPYPGRPEEPAYPPPLQPTTNAAAYPPPAPLPGVNYQGYPLPSYPPGPPPMSTSSDSTVTVTSTAGHPVSTTVTTGRTVSTDGDGDGD